MPCMIAPASRAREFEYFGLRVAAIALASAKITKAQVNGLFIFQMSSFIEQVRILIVFRLIVVMKLLCHL